ncbi:MAG: hypothetical protein IPP94_08815 [Ignavibacteria bacterium]|nr:hypothetical protein [Ignavibacteria bacterium]
MRRCFLFPALTAVIAVLSITPARSQQFWQQTAGPFLGNLLCLAALPNGDILAGSDRGGLFRSTDGGANWALFALAGRSVRVLHARSNGELLAGLDDSVMVSPDNGATWNVTKAPSIQSANGIAIDAQGTIFVGSWGGIIKSMDNGVNWADCMSGLPNVSVNALAITPAGVLFSAHQNRGLFKSTDGGASWNSAWPDLESVSVRSISVADSSTIYIATVGTGIYKSTDGGTTWEAKTDGMDKLDCSVVVSTSPLNVTAGTLSGRVYASTDGGTAWTQLFLTPHVDAIAAILAPTATDMLLGVTWDGMYRSTDAGGTWVRSSSGFMNMAVSSMARNSKGTIFAVNPSFNDIMRSKDLGATWSPASGGKHMDTRSVAVMNNDYLYAGTPRGVQHSTDDGDTWTVDTVGMTQRDVRFLAISGNRSIFASMFGGTLYRSTDYGQNWSMIAPNLGGSDIISFTISETGVLFAGTVNAGAYRSTDNGNTWKSISKGLIRLLVPSIAYHKDFGLFIGSYGEFQRSMDQGESWTRISYNLMGGTVNAVAIASNGVPIAGQEVRGVYYLDVTNSTWIRANGGLDNTSILSFLSYDDATIFAGTDGNGIYRTLRIPTGIEPAVAAAASLSITGYPNPISMSRDGAVSVRIDGMRGHASMRITLTDVLGRQVYERVSASAEGPVFSSVPVRGIPNGTYMLRVDSGALRGAMRILVLR